MCVCVQPNLKSEVKAQRIQSPIFSCLCLSVTGSVLRPRDRHVVATGQHPHRQALHHSRVPQQCDLRVRRSHQVRLLLRPFTGLLDTRRPHLQQTGECQFKRLNRLSRWGLIHLSPLSPRRAAACQCATGRSSFSAAEEKAARPRTPSCVTTQRRALS